MQSIKVYVRAVVFSLKLAFKNTSFEMALLTSLYVVRGTLPYISSFLLGRLVNSIVYNIKNGQTNLWSTLLLYAIVSALPVIIGNLQTFIERLRMLKFQMEMDLMFLRKREEIDIATYEDPEFQDLIMRAFRNGGPNPIFQITRAQFDTMFALTSFFVGTFLATRFNVYVYLVIIVCAIPSFLTDVKYAGMGWSIWSKASPEQRKLDDLRQHIRFKLQLIEVKLLGAGPRFLKEIKDIFFDFAQRQKNLEKNRVWITTGTDLLAFVGFTIGLWIIVKSVASGEYQVGTLVFIIGTLSNVRSSISNLLDSISSQYENGLIIGDLMQFLNTKPVIVESTDPVKIDLKASPEIVFENVSFKYAKADKWSLRNVSLTFKAGDNVGLVGNNGAGKTTLVKLLCRIYEPTEGRILINGIDLKDIATKEWWSYLAVMFQDYASYDFLVKEAIAVGRPDKNLNLTKVVEASKVSQSDEFIKEWEHKYDEQLGVEFKGKEPSKGQRQKLSIAKILYRDGFVMILDEPTASVDAESEAKIFDSIENLPKDRTAILISHDFSTISQCDKIFVLDKGTLVEEGTHKELMKNKSMYSELYKLQADRFKK